jgi:3-oxoacyl-[acyl-carrier protein] reductase
MGGIKVSREGESSDRIGVARGPAPRLAGALMVSKTALVTGASRGIGRGIAIELARAGGRVAINYAGNAEAAAEALAQVKSAGGDGFLVQGDVAIAADRDRLVKETVGKFGRIDLLVNNAGVAPKVRADLLDAGEESFDRLFAINLKGPYFLTQLVAKQMLQQPPDTEGFRGRIVNITSISVYAASINRGDYCMVKAGLAMMTKLFADRLANDGINVYEIRPGVIATDMTGGVKEKYDKLILQDERGITPIRRWGKPEDVGRAVRAIVEDRFPFSTGAVFDVDGGFHLHRL